MGTLTHAAFQGDGSEKRDESEENWLTSIKGNYEVAESKDLARL